MPSQSSSADNISGIRSGEHDASFLDMLPDDNKQPYSSPIKHRDSHGPNGWGVGKRFEEEMKPDMEELKKGAFAALKAQLQVYKDLAPTVVERECAARTKEYEAKIQADEVALQLVLAKRAS